MDENELMNDASPEENGENEEKKPVNIFADIIDWIDTIVYSVLAIITIFTFVTRMSTVDGDSMNPTLIDGDKLMIVNAFTPPEHNDILVVWADRLPNDNSDIPGKAVVKRVIGVPGDTISLDIERGSVIRNGKELPISIDSNGVIIEDGHMINTLTTDPEDFIGEITVPDGYLFLMGDNRNNSTDSRSGWIGLVDSRNVIGKAYLRIFPSDKIGGIV